MNTLIRCSLRDLQNIGKKAEKIKTFKIEILSMMKIINMECLIDMQKE